MKGERCIMRYPTAKAMTSLSEKLNLPKQTPYYQDWEYEVVDFKRIHEFIAHYENNSDDDEKFTLMIIIIASCNDALEEGGFSESVWERVKTFLIKDNNLHKDTIDYWSLESYEKLEDCFEITPLIRAIKSCL